MKYVDDYRDAADVKRYAALIRRTVTRPWTVMEVCGGQTHAIVRFGLDQLLPPGVEFVHGPGCPVCVTPIEIIDQAVAIARRPGTIFCSFGDMLRVPGSSEDLFAAKADGADVRIVYSPMDALKIAEGSPRRETVFFAVGFETTAPANAMAVFEAKRRGVENFSMIVSHVLVPPAVRAIFGSKENRIQGLLAAGHVCTITGFEEYEPLARAYRIPIVVTGFEPVDILQGLWMCLRQLERGTHEVQNQYARSVRRTGNDSARRLLREVFRVVPRRWRGIGEIPESGLGLSEPYAAYDATLRFGLETPAASENTACRAGWVLQGRLKPYECPEFGRGCTPERPLGAPMVSGEGACAAYYRYRLPEEMQVIHADK